MTLREKFSEEPININLYNFKLTVDSAKKLEKIADEFAIGFAVWLSMWCELGRDRDGWYIHGGKWYTSNELLKIYKKEKGL
jgi:hypothetical protein